MSDSQSLDSENTGKIEANPQIQEAMNLALSLAELAAQEGEVPVGAVVLYQGKPIGKGRNQKETKKDPFGHAEILAMQEAALHQQSWRLTDCILVVTLEPCPMCLAAAQQARIQTLIYSAQDLKGGPLSLGYSIHQDPRTNHRFQVERYPMESCGKILSDFFAKRRSQKRMKSERTPSES
jgi:tRNA(adenine34) deaminase